MFSPTYTPSGLTEKDCDLMVEYLNKAHNPVPDDKYKSIYWESGIVCKADDYKLKMKSQTPIVSFRSVCLGRDKGRSLEEFKKISGQIKQYFDTHFKNGYFFNDDQYKYYITDLRILAQLRDEALAFQQTNILGKSL